MTSYGRNIWNPERLALCACGWGQGLRFRNLDAANRAIAIHLEEGTEGCDHAVDILLAPEASQ